MILKHFFLLTQWVRREIKMKKFVVLVMALGIIMPSIVINDKKIKAEDILEENTTLDTDFIYSVTENLSNVVNDYHPRGRCFGTAGERYSAEYINTTMTTIGLQNVNKERIGEVGGSDLAKRLWPDNWALEVKVGVGGTYKPIECFPIMTTGLDSYEWDFERRIVDYTGYWLKDINESESENDSRQLPIWLIDVNPDDPYGWVTYVYLMSAFMSGFILMDYHDDTHFMVQPGRVLKPGISINGSEGNWIKDEIANSSKIVYGHLINEYHTEQSVESYNVIGEIPGVINSEIVVIGGHYDAWWCQGSSDNAAGPAITLAIAKYLMDNDITPKYRLRFVAFAGEEYLTTWGSERIGFRGSRYYVHHAHADEWDEIKYMINVDMVAHTTIGDFTIYSNDGNVALEVENIANQLDYEARTGNGLTSVDSPMTSDDQIFNINTTAITIAFGKEPYDWYHRDGVDHTKGDTMGHIDASNDDSDLNVTSEIVLSTVIKYGVNDTTSPDSCIEYISPYWHSASQVPFIITATASDDISGVESVELFYRYSTDNSTWNPSWTSFGLDNEYPWEWQFTPPHDDGYYEFYSVATDKVGNVENVPSTSDEIAGVDTTSPNTWMNAISPYWQNTLPFTTAASGSDDLSGIKKIIPFHMYSTDNTSWGSWIGGMTDTEPPWEWSFNPGEGDGYYRFATKSEDIAGNVESLPVIYDTICCVDTYPPEITDVKAIPHGQEPGEHVNITCDVEDALSGIDVVRVNITYPDNSWINETMIKVTDANTFYYNATYSMIETYSYYIWATDKAGNQIFSGMNSFFIKVGVMAFYPGWNLITIPVENSWTAETLGQAIPSCTVVIMFDGNYQTFVAHVVGVPWEDFDIENGVGYFIYVTNNEILVPEGSPIGSVSVPIYPGWNQIGWYHDYDTNAEDLGSYIPGCSVVIKYNALNQIFKTHVVGVPWDNFVVKSGMGLHIYTTSQSIWDGDTSNGDGDGGGSGGGGDGDGGGSGGGLPHPIYGYVYVKGEEPVAGANITLINNRTQDESYDETEEDGYYGIDLGNMGWQDGDNLTILVNGTGEFEGWTGTAYMTVDEDLVPQKVDDINLIEP